MLRPALVTTLLRNVLRRALCVLAVASHALACGAPAPVRVAGSITLSEDVARDVGHAVFEVVVPKPADAVTYATALPEELVPLQWRNAKFLPLGTAFAISPTQFVTAAHVVNAIPGSPLFLRDGAGATYEVSRVLKFSERRDLALVEIAGAPPGVAPLLVQTSVAIGESVFTVGNAGGEGVIVRGGAITSFTPEPVSGEWKDLRFTSPTSPGNSGGPLVDASGHVVGVVVATNLVDGLSFAVPMGELEKVPGDHAEFSRAAVSFKEDRHETFVDVTFTAPLPSTLGEFYGAARRSFLERMKRDYADFDAKFGRELFPNHPGLQTFLPEPSVPMGFGIFTLGASGAWSVTRSPPYVPADVAPGQRSFSYSSPDKMSGEILLDRPKGMPLASFFEAPQVLADAVVRTGNWTARFAGREVGIRSLGALAEKERWQDDYGRPWFTFVWRMDRTRESVVFHCLTNPAGWACVWNRIPTVAEDSTRVHAKRWAKRLTFTYYGFLEDWIQYLRLSDRYKPKVLRGAAAELDDTGLTLNVGPLVVAHLRLPSLTGRSSLYAPVSVDPTSLHEERIYDAYVNPRIENTYSFGVHEVLAPLPGSPEVEMVNWPALESGRAPFDDVPAVEAGTMNAIKRGVTAPPRGGRTRMYLEYCRNRVTDPKTDLEASCAKFREALRIEGGR